MAVFPRLLKRCVPFLFVLVLLISLLPQVSASAEAASSQSLSNFFIDSTTTSSESVFTYGFVDYPITVNYGNANSLFYDEFSSTAWDAYKRSLSQLGGIYQVSDLLSSANSVTLNFSFDYTGSANSTYTPVLNLYVSFLDSSGEYISYSLLKSESKKWPASGSYSATLFLNNIPSNCEYFRFFLDFTHGNISSATATLKVNFLTDRVDPPVNPTVTSSTMKNYEYDLGAAASPLSVHASVTDAGVLSYQWYENTVNSTSGGAAISGATSATYTPSTGSSGTKYYYCKVTNTLNSLASVAYSGVASVSVIVPADTPTFDSNLLSSYSFTLDCSALLSVSASVSDGGALSYQWYINTVNSTSGGSAISGAISSTYTPPTDALGMKYYYCRVTNTLGSLTASVYSNVAAVVVAEPTFYISGYYVFESDLSNCNDFYLDISGGTRDESAEFTSVKFDRYSLVFDLSQGVSLTVWTLNDGWIHEHFKNVYFDEEEVPASVYGCFLSAVYSVRDSAGDVPYLTTISIDGVEYHFFDYLAWTDAYPSSPNVSVTITETGVRMQYGSVVKIWTYTGDDDFAGFRLPGYSDEAFPVGFSGILPGTTGADTMIEAVPAFLYSASFNVDGQIYTFSDYQLPDVVMTVTDVGLVLTDGVTTYTHIESVRFDGYMLSQDAETYLAVGEQFVFRASDYGSVSYTQNLYVKEFTPIIEAGQWECNSLVMTGEFVDLSPWPAGLTSVPLVFVSNRSEFTSMSYQYDPYFGYSLFYDNARAYGFEALAAVSDFGWATRSYAQIYLASDQAVDLAFYDWFISNFTRIGDDPVDPVYYTTVNIYDSTGSVLLYTETYHSVTAPIVSLKVQEDGCVFSYGNQTSSWSAGNGEFYGFNLAPAATTAFYKTGLIYSLPGGHLDDLIINLYVVSSSVTSADAGSVFESFIAFLVVPIQAFFSVEFIPGFSFGTMSLFALLLGLLFWFLKVSK